MSYRLCTHPYPYPTFPKVTQEHQDSAANPYVWQIARSEGPKEAHKVDPFERSIEIPIITLWRYSRSGSKPELIILAAVALFSGF